MQDLSPLEHQRRDSVRLALGSFLALRGYQAVELPLLEETELFLRKSGGELAARMYSFTDPGGNRVSLRPEFTASVLRSYLESEPQPPLPHRVQYCGPVFRHGGAESPDALRQFTQLGAELLGAAYPLADVEVLSIACGGLASLGVRGFQLALGHVGAVMEALEAFGLSERAQLFLLASVAALRSGGPQAVEELRRRAAALGLLGVRASVVASPVDSMPPQHTEALVQALRESAETSMGRRSREEVLTRLLRKLQGTDDPARLEQALEFTARLATISGPPAASLRQAAALLKEYHLPSSALDGCRAVVELLGRADLAGTAVLLDFGLARGIAYYTGLVFELRHPALEGEPSLGGGGRYDGLTKSLGAAGELPALGFAWTLERVLELQGPRSEAAAAKGDGGVLVVALAEEAAGAALEAAQRRWGRGELAELGGHGHSLQQHLEHARSRRLGAVVVVNQQGKEQRHDVAPA